MEQQHAVRKGGIVCESVKTHTHVHTVHNVTTGTLMSCVPGVVKIPKNPLCSINVPQKKPNSTKMEHYITLH